MVASLEISDIETNGIKLSRQHYANTPMHNAESFKGCKNAIF